MVSEPSKELIQQLTNAQNEILHNRSIIMSTSDCLVGTGTYDSTVLQGCLDADPNEYLHATNELRKCKSLANEKDYEIDQLKQDIESLEWQLSKAKLAAANSVVAPHVGAANRPLELEESTAIPSEVLDEKRTNRRSGERRK